MLNNLKPIRTLKYLLSTCLVVLASACNSFATPVHTGEKIMSELTQTMRPICVGRFIIEIPAVGIVNNWHYEIDYFKITSVLPSSLSQKAFDVKVRHLEALLKTSPHKTEGFRLKTKTQLSPERVLL